MKFKPGDLIRLDKIYGIVLKNNLQSEHWPYKIYWLYNKKIGIQSRGFVESCSKYGETNSNIIRILYS